MNTVNIGNLMIITGVMLVILKIILRAIYNIKPNFIKRLMNIIITLSLPGTAIYIIASLVFYKVKYDSLNNIPNPNIPFIILWSLLVIGCIPSTINPQNIKN